MGRLFSSTNKAMLEEAEWLQWEGESLRRSKKYASSSKRRAVSLSPIFDASSAAEYLALWEAHERDWVAFERDPAKSEVPWPPCDSDILEFLRRANPRQSEKEVYRLACLRWHPDKFAQRFFARLSSEQQHTVRDRLTSLFQSMLANVPR